MNPVVARLRTHIHSFFPRQEKSELTWPEARVLEYVPEFRVIEIAPERTVDAWIYVTLGGSELSANERVGVEFVLLAQDQDDTHVETLSLASFYQMHPTYKLGLGSTVELGHPWCDSSRCDRFLAALPYPFGPAFEWCDVGNGRRVQFLWLVPITESEESYIATEGLELFEHKIESSGVNVADPRRRSIV